MIEVETITRKWGNSIGISLPKDVVKKIKIVPNTMIKLFLQDKKVDLSKYFGTLEIMESTQNSLDDIRKGEE